MCDNHQVGLPDNWGEKLTYPFPSMIKPGEILSILDVVFRVTEVYGLASHLATSDIYRDERSIVIDLTLYNIKGRALNRHGVNSFVFSQPAGVEKISYTVTREKEDIMSRWRTLAIEAA